MSASQESIKSTKSNKDMSKQNDDGSHERDEDQNQSNAPIQTDPIQIDHQVTLDCCNPLYIKPWNQFQKFLKFKRELLYSKYIKRKCNQLLNEADMDYDDEKGAMLTLHEKAIALKKDLIKDAAKNDRMVRECRKAATQVKKARTSNQKSKETSSAESNNQKSSVCAPSDSVTPSIKPHKSNPKSKSKETSSSASNHEATTNCASIDSVTPKKMHLKRKMAFDDEDEAPSHLQPQLESSLQS